MCSLVHEDYTTLDETNYPGDAEEQEEVMTEKYLIMMMMRHCKKGATKKKKRLWDFSTKISETVKFIIQFLLLYFILDIVHFMCK